MGGSLPFNDILFSCKEGLRKQRALLDAHIVVGFFEDIQEYDEG